MGQIAFDLAVIFALVVANGVFSMSEIAVVSARKARLRRMAEGGDGRARRALELAESPNRFLATVQVGITLVGVVAATFGGATLSAKLAAELRTVEWLAPYANQAAFVLVVAGLAYFTLVIGELVPKRLGLGNPEAIARAVAGPMHLLSVTASPLVRLLSASTEGLLRLLRFKPQENIAVTKDEVKLLVREGLRAGEFLPHEPGMVEGVLALDRVHVDELMTPRAKILWINAQEPHEAFWRRIAVSGHTIFPVYEGNRDRAVGVLSVKALYAKLASGAPVNVRELISPPLVVPASQSASGLLEKFKETGKHVALVADEFGGIIGMVSLHDIMEAIIGKLPSADEPPRPSAKRREDGSWFVDGSMDVEEFERAVPGFPLPRREERDYRTLAGLIVKRLGHIPPEGTSFELDGWRVEVVDMDGHRVDKVALIPPKPAPEPP